MRLIRRMLALDLLPLALSLLWSSSAHSQSSAVPAGGFAPLCNGQECPAGPLPYSKFKSLLLQFYDPTSSGLAEPLTYLVYRQIFESISDVSGSGVVRLLPSDATGADRDTANTLSNSEVGDHTLAESLANALNAQFATWGTLISEEGVVSLSTSMTANKQGIWSGLDAVDGTKDIPPPALDRLNLGTQTLTLSDLYGNQATIRCGRSNNCPPGDLKLYSKPESGADASLVLEGELAQLNFRDGRFPTGKYVPVTIVSTGKQGWVYAYHLTFMPRQVYVSSYVPATVRSTSDGRRRQIVQGPRRFEVISMRISELGQREYLVKLDESTSGWIETGDVRSVWSLAFVHLTAGIHRRARGYNESARSELELYLSQINQEEDNVAASFAHQVMASTFPIFESPGLARSNTRALESLDAAVRLTPNAPSPYLSRAVAKARLQMNWESDIAEGKATANVFAVDTLDKRRFDQLEKALRAGHDLE